MTASCDNCGNCHGEYEEIDITNTRVPGIEAVPVTEINGERILGFDRPTIKKALENAKK